MYLWYARWGRGIVNKNKKTLNHKLPSGKNTCLPMQEMQEMRVPSLGQEDPLEEGMATHSGILAWRIPQGQKSLVGYSPWGPRVGHV